MALLVKKASTKGAKNKNENLAPSHWLYRVYLAGVSVIAIIVMSINLGVALTSLGKHLLITNDEYVQSEKVWEVRECSQSRWVKDKEIVKTEDEITQCEEKAKVKAIAVRSLELKEQMIESFAWLIVFAALFLFHYPKFLATRREG